MWNEGWLSAMRKEKRLEKNISENNYNRNVELLKKYEWCNVKEFPKFEVLDKIIIEDTDAEYTILDRLSGKVSVIKKDNIIMVKQLYTESFLLYNINDFSNIASLSKSIKYFVSAHFFGERKALYVYYDNLEEFLFVLQTTIEIDALEEGNLVFFVGKEALLKYDYLGIESVKQIISSMASEKEKKALLRDIIDSDKKRWQEYETIIADYSKWYQENGSAIESRIHNKNPRIMFLSTKTRTYSFDKILAKYFSELGLDVKVQIEATPFYKLFMMCKISQMQMIRDINDFKPDIIFTTLGERYKDIIAPEIYWLTILIDDLGKFKDPRWIQQLTPKDYFWDPFFRTKPLESFGYICGRVITCEKNVLLPTDTYKKQTLSPEETEKYGADIVLLANTMSIDEINLRARMLLCNWLEPELVAAAEKIVKLVYEKTREGILLKYQQIQDYVELLRSEIPIKKIRRERFILECKYFIEIVAYQAFRHKIADWLIDNGYTSLKLYGKGWAEMEKFAPYACSNTHEETPKIYQAAKININPCIWMTVSYRTTESIMCGGFILNNAKIDDKVWSQPSVLDEEPIFYCGKEELLKKIDYYLVHPMEREKIVDRCRKKILLESENDFVSEKILNQMADTIDIF